MHPILKQVFGTQLEFQKLVKIWNSTEFQHCFQALFNKAGFYARTHARTRAVTFSHGGLVPSTLRTGGQLDREFEDEAKICFFPTWELVPQELVLS